MSKRQLWKASERRLSGIGSDVCRGLRSNRRGVEESAAQDSGPISDDAPNGIRLFCEARMPYGAQSVGPVVPGIEFTRAPDEVQLTCSLHDSLLPSSRSSLAQPGFSARRFAAGEENGKRGEWSKSTLPAPPQRALLQREIFAPAGPSAPKDEDSWGREARRILRPEASPRVEESDAEGCCERKGFDRTLVGGSRAGSPRRAPTGARRARISGACGKKGAKRAKAEVKIAGARLVPPSSNAAASTVLFPADPRNLLEAAAQEPRHGYRFPRMFERSWRAA
ncbi:hypothetical protein KM043_003037 [Ampulex compressa]|nr:hypothetical protein KM043_003037 [Ampulex compressa]